MALGFLGCGEKPPVDRPRPPPTSPGTPPQTPPPTPPTVPARDAEVIDPFQPAPGAYQLPRLQASIPTYALSVDEGLLQKFMEDPTLAAQAATFEAGGKRWSATMNVRGGSSRWYPKKSWRIELPDGERFDGRRKLNLIAEMADRTMMVEKLAYDLLSAAQVPASGARYVRLVVNGKYRGLYLDLERVDKALTGRLGFLDDDPSIYRCGKQDCELKLDTEWWQQPWEKQTNEDQPHDDLEAFLRLVNRGSEVTFADALEENLDVEAYVRMMAIDAVISNDIMMDAGSYLVHDHATGKWSFLPWDYNNSAARWWPNYGLGMEAPAKTPVPMYSAFDPRVATFYRQRLPGARQRCAAEGRTDCVYQPAFSTLNTRIFANPKLRARYLAALEHTLDTLFRDEVLHPRIDAMYALIRKAVEEDPYVLLDTEGKPDPEGLAKFHQSAAYLKQYVTRRVAYLRAELQRMKAYRPTLQFEAVDPHAGWIRLRNAGDAAIDLSRLVLTDDLRRPMIRSPNLPPVTLAPGETVEVQAALAGVTLGGAGELGIYAEGTVAQPYDVFFFAELPAPKRYVRLDGEWTVE